jgi:putative membrane protein insertion efficiency factor
MKSPVKYLLMGLIRLYQIVLSPLVNWRGPVCKYYPSCSHYGYEAVETHGAVKGGALTVWRVLRCNPWGAGGYDPVPVKSPKKGRKARNLSDAETSSPCDETQTSDRTLQVGYPSEPDRSTDRPDLTSFRGA